MLTVSLINREIFFILEIPDDFYFLNEGLKINNQDAYCKYPINISFLKEYFYKTSTGLYLKINEMYQFMDLSFIGEFSTINAFYNKELEKSPLPTDVVNTVLKIVVEKNPKFSYPVSKGASLILTLQHFAYIAFEGSVLKSVNKTI